MDSSRKRILRWGVLILVVAVVVAPAGAVVGSTVMSIEFNPDNNVETSGMVPIVAPDGMQVNVVGDTNQTMTENWPTSGTVDVATEDGGISFFSSGDANATIQVEDIVGSWTNVTNLEADPNTITIDPEDKSSFVVGQEIDSISVRDTIEVDDGNVDFVYAGTTGQSRVTLQGVTANQELVAVDADTGNYLDVATSTGGGAVTFDALTNSEHSVLIQTADFSDPTLTNGSPTGDLSNEPTQISVDVNDTEFDVGDSVDVTIDLDGSQIHSETITANQTVSVAMPQSGQLGGSHQWTVEADPEYGNTAQNVYNYRVPSNLTIRNERNHSEIITSPIESDVTFFGEDRIVTRNTDDGVVNMTGLPVNQDFIAEVVPSDENWTTRSIYFESIYQQQSIYLLNTSAVDTTEARFVLNDPTGQFGTETIVFIQRPINVSSETTWQTVHADQFGTEGVTATLEEGQRYRIRIQNAEGDEQLIGPYRADVSETVEVEPGAPGIDMGESTDGYRANAVLSNTTLTYAYDDPTGDTEQLTIWIHEKGDPSNRLVANSSYFNVGEVSATESLTANESEKEWVVNFIIERNDQEFRKEVVVSNRKNLFGAVPQPWRAMIGIGLLLLLAGAFSQLNAAIGGVVVAVVGGILYYIGLLSGMTTGIGVALAIFVAVLNQIRQSGGP